MINVKSRYIYQLVNNLWVQVFLHFLFVRPRTADSQVDSYLEWYDIQVFIEHALGEKG